MFYNGLREEKLAELKDAQEQYALKRNEVEQKCINLFELRRSLDGNVIQPVESYLNSLSNKPIELITSIEELKIAYKEFAKVFELEKIYVETVKQTAAGTAMGVAGGVGVAALAPSAAMAVATTFGTASTGVSITVLNGAAATNAALAWLGGGALAAGGGGMAAGNALLAMAGPIGWGIAGTALVTGSIWKAWKNKEAAQVAQEAKKKYVNEIIILKTAENKVRVLGELTLNHADGVKGQLKYLKDNAPVRYSHFSDKDTKELIALVNNIHVLVALLNKRIMDSEENMPDETFEVGSVKVHWKELMKSCEV